MLQYSGVSRAAIPKDFERNPKIHRRFEWRRVRGRVRELGGWIWRRTALGLSFKYDGLSFRHEDSIAEVTLECAC